MTPESTPDPTPDATPDPTPDPTATPDPTPAPVTAAYIVSFRSGILGADQAAAIAAAGATDLDSIAVLRMHAVQASAAAADALRADPSVASVELDRSRAAEATPDDASYGDQWSLPQIGWDQVYGSVTPSGSAIVAVLDTGVDASHPDIDDSLVSGASFVAGSAWNADANGHGTAMAGIVAAETGNGIGVAGVGFAGVKVMPITVLGPDGLGRDSDIIEGLVWAADHGADVALLAFSATGYSSALQAAVDYAWANGVVVVAATGNDGSSTPAFPAGDRGVVGVSNTDQTDTLNASSNYGASAFLAAPGTEILTLVPGGGTASVTGSSAAAAAVAGAAALLRAVDPSLSAGAVIGRLARSADAAGTVAETGNGRLNLARALADTGTAEVQPAGAAPVGDGGPFVGPYVAAAVALVKSGPSSTVAGATFSYTIVATGNGNQGTITVTDTVPATLVVGTPTGSQTTGSGGTSNCGKVGNLVTCTLTGPSNNSVYTVTIPVTVPVGATNGTTYSNTAAANCSGNCSGAVNSNTVITTVEPPNGMSIGDATVIEGTVPGTVTATFTVTRSSPTGTSTVAFATAPGTAVGGASCPGTNDYINNSGTLTFGVGVTTQSINVLVCRDAVFEANETFTVNLSSPTNATTVDATGTGTITNDDTAPTLSINDVTLAEGNAGTTTLRLPSPRARLAV